MLFFRTEILKVHRYEACVSSGMALGVDKQPELTEQWKNVKLL